MVSIILKQIFKVDNKDFLMKQIYVSKSGFNVWSGACLKSGYIKGYRPKSSALKTISFK